MVGVKHPTTAIDAARSRLTARNRHVYRQEGEFFYLVPDRHLAQIILVKPDYQVYIEHVHQPLSVVTPDGKKKDETHEAGKSWLPDLGRAWAPDLPDEPPF